MEPETKKGAKIVSILDFPPQTKIEDTFLSLTKGIGKRRLKHSYNLNDDVRVKVVVSCVSTMVIGCLKRN